MTSIFSTEIQKIPIVRTGSAILLLKTSERNNNNNTQMVKKKKTFIKSFKQETLK